MECGVDSLLIVGALELLLELRGRDFRLHAQLTQMTSAFGSWFAHIRVGLRDAIASDLTSISGPTIDLLEIMQTHRV